jgi:hypothetical protein
MKVHLEFLYHYRCCFCNGWWSIADLEPEIGQIVYCPYCQQKHKVQAIENHCQQFKRKKERQ